MRFNKNLRVPFLLAALWGAILVWQSIEHFRVKEYARNALLNRARDTSNTLGIVIRSRQFFGVITERRLESTLNGLVESAELKTVALLNSEGDVVASVGEALEQSREMLQVGEHWKEDSVTVINLVDLGDPNSEGGRNSNPPILIPASELESISREGRNRWPRGRGERRTNMESSEANSPPEVEQGADSLPEAEEGVASQNKVTPPKVQEARRRGRGRPRFGRPPWMEKDRYQELLKKQGLHGFVFVMSTRTFQNTVSQDLGLRGSVCAFALFSVIGFGVARRNMLRSSALQMRLLRAKEMNVHLRESKIAAAGLAHETRNPLNLIRGFAQMISKDQRAGSENQTRSCNIVREVDQVTEQLNEFINYSKPREVKPTPVPIKSVIRDIAGALESDLEDNSIDFEVIGKDSMVEADEQLFRQAVFNILMNSIQAISSGGRIEARLLPSGKSLCLEISDNGPGIEGKLRQDIFRPYYTGREKGTGLGLAIVKQIVLAHGWDIECSTGKPCGAVFRISGIKVVAGRST